MKQKRVMVTLYSEHVEFLEAYRSRLPFNTTLTDVANLAIRKGRELLPEAGTTNNKKGSNGKR